jgi:uncharacterized repeat protein (TIGR01451 family)
LSTEYNNLLIKQSINNNDSLANDIVTFTNIITNNNDISVTDLVITDTLPNNYEFVENSLKVNDVAVAQNITEKLELASLESKGTDTIIYQAKSVNAGTNISTKSSVTCNYLSETGEKNTITKESEAILSNIKVLNASATIIKTSDKINYEVGDTATFTITITNDGNVDLSELALKETLNNNFTFVNNSIKIDNVSYSGDLTSDINLGIIKVSNQKVVTFNAVATTVASNITNQVTLNGTYKQNETEYLITKESNVLIVSIIEKTNASFTIVKSLNSDTLLVNNTYTFKLVLKNTGDVAIDNLSVIDDLATDYLEFVNNSIKIDGVLYPKTLADTITINELALNQEIIITFDAKCLKKGNTKNEVEVVATYKNKAGEDTKIIQNSNSLPIIIDAITPNLEIIKKYDEDILLVNEVHTCTLTVSNKGNVAINNLNITENLNNHLEFVPDSIVIDGTTSTKDLTESLDLGTVDINTNKVISFKFKCVEIGASISNKVIGNGTYLNETGATQDIESESNELIVNILEQIDAEIEITKSINEEKCRLNDTYTINLEIENLGNVTLNNFVVSENLDNHFELVDGSIKIDNNTYAGTLDKIILNDVESLASHVITFEIKAIKLGDGITNMVTGKGTYKNKYNIDTNYEVKSNEIMLSILNPIENNLSITNEILDNDPRLNEIETFKIKVTNNGNIDLENVIVENNLDNHFEFVSNSIKINNVVQEGELFDLIKVGDLKIGENVLITFDAKCIKLGENISNISSVTADYLYKEKQYNVNQDSNELLISIKEPIIGKFSVNKSINDEESYVGEIKKFTINLVNTGNTKISNLIINDTLNDKFKCIDDTIKINGYHYNGKLNNIVVNSLDVGNPVQITYEVECTSVGEAINICHVTGIYQNKNGEDVSIQGDSAKIVVNILENGTPNITVYKETVQDNIFVNDIFTYKIIVTNNGNVALTNGVLNDTMGENLKIINNTIKVNGVLKNTNSLANINLGNLDVNETTTITYNVTSNYVKDNIINMASVIYKHGNDDVVGNSNKSIVNIVGQKGRMIFTKQVDKDEVELNDTVHFIMDFKNVGKVDLEHVTFADNLSEYFQYVDNSTKLDGVVTGNIITGITLDKVLVEETHRVEFDCVAIKEGNNIPNTAVMAAYYDNVILNPETNEVYVTVLKDKNASATLVKEISKNVFNKNEIIPITLTFTNTGNVNLDEVIITDNLNDNISFVEGSIKVNGINTVGNVTSGLTLSHVLKNETKVITFNAQANKLGNDLTNESNAKVSYNSYNSDKKEFNVTSNVVTFNISNEISPDLTIEKSSNETLVTKDEEINITLQITNNGNTTLTNIFVADALPAGLQFIDGSLMVDYVKVTGDITKGINLEDMKQNYVTIVTFRALVTLDNVTIQNRANATYSYKNGDDTIGNGACLSNLLDIVSTVSPEAILNIVKESNKDTYLLNEEATFTLTISNVGNIAAKEVKIQDALDSSYTFVDKSLVINNVSSNENINNQVSIGEILAGDSATISFKAVTNTLKENILNKAVGTYFYYDINSLIVNKTMESNGLINHIEDTTEALISIDKTSVCSNVVIGEDITFSLKIKNDGNVDASNVTIQDILSDNLKFVLNSVYIDNNSSNQDITTGINLGTMSSGKEIIIKFKALAIKAGKNVGNKATAKYSYIKDGQSISGQTYSNSVLFNVNTNVSGILIVEKNSEFDNIYLGSKNIFTLNVQNIGEVDINNAIIQDYLDNHYTFVDGSIEIDGEKKDGDISKGIVLPTIKKDTNILITFEALGNTLGNNINNVAILNYGFVDETGLYITETNYSLPNITNIIEKKEAIIRIVKNIEKATIEKNELNSYSLTITNTGNVKGTNLLVVDIIPSNYEYVNGTTTLDGIPQNGSIEKGIKIDSLQANETRVIKFEVIGRILEKGITNTASVSYSYINSLNNTIYDTKYSNIVTSSIIDRKEANLFISKKMNKKNLLVNEINTISVVVQNIGNTKAYNIKMVDDLNGYYEPVNNYITCNGINVDGDITKGIRINDLDVEEVATISFDVKAIKLGENIENKIKMNYEYTNSLGTISSDEKYSNIYYSNINSKDKASLDVSVNSLPTQVLVDDIYKYAITITNDGTLPAEDIVLSNILPIEVSFIDESVKVNNMIITNVTSENIRIPNLNPNEAASIEFSVNALLPGNVLHEAVVDYKYVDAIKGEILAVAVAKSETNILSDDNPSVEFVQSVDNLNISLYDTNKFQFTITNNSKFAINNVILSKFVPKNYEILEDTINVQQKTSDIVFVSSDVINLGYFAEKESKIVSFNAVGKMVGTDISNIAELTYEYQNKLNKTVVAGVNSNEILTNIIENEVPSINVEEDIEKIMALDKEKEVNIVLTNIGSKTANNVFVKEVLDDSFYVVDSSLKIDDKVSPEDILTGILFTNVMPKEQHIISYKIIPIRVSERANKLTDVTYSYTDKNNIERIMNVQKNNYVKIINQVEPSISIIKNSDKLNYDISDIANFRFIITNNGNLPIKKVTIKDDINDNYQFVDHSIQVNGNNISGSIIDGITIDEINVNEKCVVIFKAKPIKEKINIENIGNIFYSYTDLENNIITKSANSNSYFTNIYYTKVPEVSIIKSAGSAKIVKTGINTFNIIVKNNSYLPIYNLYLSDILDDSYKYIDGSLEIDSVKSIYLPEHIYISKLDADQSLDIKFRAVGSIPKQNIMNNATLSYNYQKNDELILAVSSSNSMYTDIIDYINSNVINLIDDISLKEKSIKILIDAEINKLKYVLENDNNIDEVLNINTSIKQMILYLSDLEQITYDDLFLILNNL